MANPDSTPTNPDDVTEPTPRRHRRALLGAAVGLAGAAVIAPAASARTVTVQGATGPAGPRGATGATGATGPRGATGATGAPGTAGIPGAVGPTGPTGVGVVSISKVVQGVTIGTSGSTASTYIACPTGSVAISGGIQSIPIGWGLTWSFNVDDPPGRLWNIGLSGPPNLGPAYPVYFETICVPVSS